MAEKRDKPFKGSVSLEKTGSNAKTALFILGGMILTGVVDKAITKGQDVAGLGQNTNKALDYIKPLAYTGVGLLVPQLVDARTNMGNVARFAGYGMAMYGMNKVGQKFFQTDLLGLGAGRALGTPSFYREVSPGASRGTTTQRIAGTKMGNLKMPEIEKQHDVMVA